MGCWEDLPPAEDFEDLGGCVDESLFRLSSLMPSSFLDFPADKKMLRQGHRYHTVASQVPLGGVVHYQADNMYAGTKLGGHQVLVCTQC